MPLHAVSVQKAAQLAQAGIPLAERVLLQQILDVTKALYQGLSWGGAGREVGRRECSLLLSFQLCLLVRSNS